MAASVNWARTTASTEQRRCSAEVSRGKGKLCVGEVGARLYDLEGQKRVEQTPGRRGAISVAINGELGGRQKLPGLKRRKGN